MASCHVVQVGAGIEDFINSTCAPSSPTKVINHSDPSQPTAPAARLAQPGQVRSAQPLLADMIQRPSKRRRTSSSAKSHGAHVPAAVGNSSGMKADSPRQQSLANPIDHIFQFHKVSLTDCASRQHVLIVTLLPSSHVSVLGFCLSLQKTIHVYNKFCHCSAVTLHVSMCMICMP